MRSLRISLILGVVAALIGLSATAAPAADDREYVKYYQVSAAYRGAPENLTEIATRFLGDGARSAEVFNLNRDRRQPDGGKLTDPARLQPGWTLQLPWDAVGAEVRYGLLPGSAPAAATPPAAPSTPAAPTSTRVPATPSSAGPAKPTRPAGCTAVAASTSRSDWAGLRLAADQAWPQSRGKGQIVAVVDSGVEASHPQLAGHVAAGEDVVTGTGRGDTDCFGTGTAMAGIIAAQPGKNEQGAVTGVAPDATVLPIRVVGGESRTKAADAAKGIDAAVRSGATVIAVGSSVDLADKGVTAAVAEAVKKDVVVVHGAQVGSAPAAEALVGVLRAGGVGVNGKGAADYRSGGVDVVAPGVNVSSLGPRGLTTASGTQYAVAFVAATAALVRAAYPELDAGQVTHRVQVSADKMGDDRQPDATFGWGMINPAVAVTLVLPEEAEAAPSSTEQEIATSGGGRSGGQVMLLVLVTLGALGGAVFLAVRIRRLLSA
ncbi:S8 family serine peptidase [Actinoplanes sp. ATCC 53533]|uniref:S8 family serine peptidase n=1 Tax=Actinoplanes sp. ATCC 53533 TaxID=1288362 RepID=UPI000F7B8262|nr:S8 family serine peptidase [Actinoplanes sp. ATCC 53533]